MAGNGGHLELTTLLRIDDVKPEDGCMWVRLACMGRCLIGSVRRNKRHGYRVAVVSPYSDGDRVSASIDRLRAVHTQVAAQRRKLKADLVDAAMFDGGTWEALSRDTLRREALLERRETGANPNIFVGPDKARAPFGIYESYEVFEESGELSDHVYVGQPWERPAALGCCYFSARDLGELDDEENGAELSALVARRRAVLTGPATESEGGALLHAVGDIWGVQSEEHAETQLLSFGAAATLSPSDRVQALMTNETAARLELAYGGLEGQRGLLTDMQTEHDELRGTG